MQTGQFIVARIFRAIDIDNDDTYMMFIEKI